MSLRPIDVVPISEARARLTELAADVVGHGTEKLLTKDGASYVALVDARKLDYYHALEAAHAAGRPYTSTRQDRDCARHDYIQS